MTITRSRRGRDVPPEVVNLLNPYPANLENHHFTFVSASEGVLATFARDNAEHMMPWWKEAVKAMRSDPALGLQINRRIFTPMRDIETGLPIKRMAICVVTRNGVQGISVDDARLAFNTDAATGQAMDPMPATTYEDW